MRDARPPYKVTEYYAGLSNSVDHSTLADVVARTVDRINRFIDVYRLVTRSPHIQRLASVHVRDIFFRDHNLGVHGASFGHGVRTAIMNRSQTELQSIQNLLLGGHDIPPWDLLFMDSEASLHSNQFTLAIVNAFQALELALQGFLEKRMASQGLSVEQVASRLDRTWRTKDRLKELVPEFAGRKLLIDNCDLWDRFCWAYDDVRNKLIHSARDLDRPRAEKAVAACRDTNDWLASIS